MLKDLGNCGCKEKYNRVVNAITSAKQNKCGLRISFDPCVYGQGINTLKFTSEEVRQTTFAYNEFNLFIIKPTDQIDAISWWDIIRIDVVW